MSKKGFFLLALNSNNLLIISSFGSFNSSNMILPSQFPSGLTLKNLSISGGFLIIASYEPKKFSIDYYLKYKGK